MMARIKARAVFARIRPGLYELAIALVLALALLFFLTYFPFESFRFVYREI